MDVLDSDTKIAAEAAIFAGHVMKQ